MGIVRFENGSGSPQVGYRLGNRIVNLSMLRTTAVQGQPAVSEYLAAIDELEAKIWDTILASSESDFLHSADEVTHLNPITPETVVCLEGCYEQDLVDDGYDPHLTGEDYHQQEWPSLSVAPSSAFCGPGEPLRIPSYANDVRPTIEVGLVVGKQAKNLEPDNALAAIAGYTIVTSLRIFDGIPNLEGYKMYDGSFACGPVVVPLPEEGLSSLEMGLSVDGHRRAVHDTEELRFTAAELVSETSQILTLQPGDLLTTGSPTRISESVVDGSTVTTRIEGAGELSNKVKQDEEHV